MKHINKIVHERLLIDGREFTPGRLTGIGRVIEGLVTSIAESDLFKEIILATFDPNAVPFSLKNSQEIKIKKVPTSFIKSEKALSDLSKDGITLFFSPYPKLPLFGTHCFKINMVHDVLDLTHPAYRRRIKTFFDAYRLKKALHRADLTWYVSEWSLKETKRYTGLTGKNPKVRYNGIDEIFSPNKDKNERENLMKYHLKPGYILVVGNGSPHKNLGVILNISDQLRRNVVFVGVSNKNQTYWKSKYLNTKAIWINHIEDEDLPSIIRGAFCLAQPSTTEGYGYPPLEAMACGIPSVVSNIAVLKETTGGNAITASPVKSEEWVSGFHRLQDRNVYQSQVEKGLKWVEPMKGRKGWEKNINDIENLLKGI